MSSMQSLTNPRSCFCLQTIALTRLAALEALDATQELLCQPRNTFVLVTNQWSIVMKGLRVDKSRGTLGECTWSQLGMGTALSCGRGDPVKMMAPEGPRFRGADKQILALQERSHGEQCRSNRRSAPEPVSVSGRDVAAYQQR